MTKPAKISKRDQKTLQEAYDAVASLTRTMNQGNNRFGSYGQSCRDAIKRWEETIARIEGHQDQ
jgi:hypothetical protein